MATSSFLCSSSVLRPTTETRNGHHEAKCQSYSRYHQNRRWNPTCVLCFDTPRAAAFAFEMNQQASRCFCFLNFFFVFFWQTHQSQNLCLPYHIDKTARSPLAVGKPILESKSSTFSFLLGSVFKNILTFLVLMIRTSAMRAFCTAWALLDVRLGKNLFYPYCNRSIPSHCRSSSVWYHWNLAQTADPQPFCFGFMWPLPSGGDGGCLVLFNFPDFLGLS